MGIGGGFDGRAAIGDVVVASSSVACQLGADSPEGYLDFGELGLTDTVLHGDRRRRSAGRPAGRPSRPGALGLHRHRHRRARRRVRRALGPGRRGDGGLRRLDRCAGRRRRPRTRSGPSATGSAAATASSWDISRRPRGVVGSGQAPCSRSPCRDVPLTLTYSPCPNDTFVFHALAARAGRRRAAGRRHLPRRRRHQRHGRSGASATSSRSRTAPCRGCSRTTRCCPPAGRSGAAADRSS